MVLPYINMNLPRVYTCSPSWTPPPTSLPIPSLWVIPVHQPRVSCIMHQTWTGDSFHIWYYTCFNAILSNHPTLALSHRVQKTVLYICVSLAVLHTGLSLPWRCFLKADHLLLYWMFLLALEKVKSFYKVFRKLNFFFLSTTVNPWTTQVLTAQVHLHIVFFQ